MPWGDGQSNIYTFAGGAIVKNSDGSFSVIGGHTYAEEAQKLNFAVQVSDGYGTTVSADTTINVSDPAAIVKGGFNLSFTAGVPQAGVTVATFVDPGGGEPNIADPNGIHYTAEINWGDGTVSIGAITFDSAADNFKVVGDHAYAVNGSFPITVTVHHESAPDAKAASTAQTGAAQTGSGSFIGKGPGGANTLLVYGTPGDDVIRVVPHGVKGDVRVIINGVSQGIFTKDSFSAIAIYGQDVNDRLMVAEDVKATAFLFPGSGNDVLVSGGGTSLLDGGAGNDRLIGIGNKPLVEPR